MLSLIDTLKKYNICILPTWDGQLVREGTQWIRSWDTKINEKTVQCATYGDWKTGVKGYWQGSQEKLTDQEERELNEKLKIESGKERSDKEKRWEETALLVQAEWEEFSETGTTPYLEKKEIDELHGCRVEAHNLGTRLIVPARDVKGKLWGYQRIYPAKIPGIDTDKVFRRGARKENCFHTLGEITSTTPALYFVEGISTAAAVYKALGNRPIISAFDAGNLGPVAISIRQVYPHIPFIFCADNDQWPDSRGQIPNPGKNKAEKAAQEVGNSTIIIPHFKEEHWDKRPTDFQDVRMLYGSEEVRKQILEPRPTNLETAPQEEPRAPSAGALEARLISRFLEQFYDKTGPTLVRQHKDFFRFTGTHWEPLDPLTTPDYFKKCLDQAATGKLKYKDVASAYSRFFIHVPSIPEGVNMFDPNPFAQTFKNGTLHLEPRPDGTFHLSFKKHSRDDYLIHCHDFNYQEDAPLNDEFEASLDRIWEGDPDIEEKKKAYFEVLGACLVPAFRKLVLFVGPPKCGKSTLILYAVNMVHKELVCSVDPSQFHGFNLESMAGKLLNYDTDISLKHPISDSILKKVEDRIPMRIRRKNVADIYAPIPGVHLWGANRMPMSNEGGEAYDRRMLVFRCGKYQPKGNEFVLDYAQHVWRSGAQGIVTRAIQGLKRLALQGGHFTVPDSSITEIAEWKEGQGDLVQDFIQDIRNGECEVDKNNTLIEDKLAQIERRMLWECFVSWTKESALNQRVMSKIKLFSRIRELGFTDCKVDGVRYFRGLKLGPADNSNI